jgi:hypothetical protein
MMRRILLRMWQDGAMATRDTKPIPTHSLPNHQRFFKVVGWPFNVKAA